MIRSDTDFDDTTKFDVDATRTWLTYSCPHPNGESRNPPVGTKCDPCTPLGAIRYGRPPSSGWWCTPQTIGGTNRTTPYLLCAPATPNDKLLTCADGHWSADG